MSYNISTLGPEWSYSSEVAKNISWDQVNIKFTESNLATIHWLTRTDISVLPVYNKYWWVVTGNIEAIYDYYKTSNRTIKTVGRHVLSIQHILACRADSELDRINEVHSHPQALKQSRKGLSRYWYHEYPALSTTTAIEWLQMNQAVICSMSAVKKFWLKVLDDQISPEDNVTCFLVLTSKKDFDANQLRDIWDDKMISFISSPRERLPEILWEFWRRNLGIDFTWSVPDGKGENVTPVVSDSIWSSKRAFIKSIQDLWWDVSIL